LRMTTKARTTRTTVTLDEDLVTRAQRLTGVKERATLVRMGLESLIAHEVAQRLIRLGGSDPDATAAPRRRFD